MEKYTKGMRTFYFGVIALAFLTAGYSMSLDKPAAGIAIFGAFSLAIVGIVGALAGKSMVGTLAEGNGVKGAASVLMSDNKPGQPAPTTPPAVKPPA
jgi:hypothetical protein